MQDKACNYDSIVAEYIATTSWRFLKALMGYACNNSLFLISCDFYVYVPAYIPKLVCMLIISVIYFRRGTNVELWCWSCIVAFHVRMHGRGAKNRTNSRKSRSITIHRMNLTNLHMISDLFVLKWKFSKVSCWYYIAIRLRNTSHHTLNK
jgi:hypothetical protein